MHITVENISKLERKLNVSLPAEDIDKEVLNRLHNLAKQTKIAGFRPGKVPFSLVQKRYQDSVLGETITMAIKSSYVAALKQEKLKPVAAPKIESAPYESGQPLHYTAIFEVYPEIKLADFSKIQVEKFLAEITSKDVDATLEKLRKQHAISHETSLGAQNGDHLLLDYVGIIDGQPFQGGNVKDTRVALGENLLLPDFEKPLYGAKSGDTVKANFKYADNYIEKSLAGKEVEFTIQVKKVFRMEIPALDEAFAKQMGVDTGGVEALRLETQQTMQYQLEQMLKKHLNDSILMELIKMHSIELPKSLVANEMERLKKQLANKEVSIEQVQRNITGSLLLGELVNHFSLKVDQKKVQDKIDSLALYHQDPKKIADWYQNNQEALAELQFMVLEEQALDLLQQKIEIVEKKIGYDEFLRGAQHA